jgi:hypothetical protein
MALPAHPWFHRAALAALVCLGSAAVAQAAAPQPGPPLTIVRVTAPIAIDGDLSDAGWKGVTPVTQWYETRVGDSVEPQVKNVGYLAYDDKFLYAAFEFEDPNPKLVRAPLGDHDQISGTTDYAGIIVDSRNDGKTAQMFLANANGLQYDAISSDVTGEDSSPDWFWDTAGKVTATGWTLEIRVPFSSLRYARTPAPTWGILLYRNYPRDQHYQFFSAKLPRDVSCFICNSSKMNGLENLPQGSHLVVAPYATTQKTAARPVLPSGSTAPLGTPLEKGPLEDEYGVDVKWSPLSGLALDGTINPDFSQVEADAAQIVANERFALFYPEKRAFFLEGVDLFSTPFTAVYTRTINNPDAGARATGRANATAFTGLWADDAGGGVVIIPGSQGSDFAFQPSHSNVGIARARRDFGQSFLSALGTFRDYVDGGQNYVVGPDYQWRPSPRHTFTGQALWSDSKTPNRPDLNPDGSGTPWEWDGRHLEDHALTANYQYGSTHYDFFAQGQELGPDFRADNGFIPQVGYREVYGQAGWTVRPQKKFFTRFRTFAQSFVDQQVSDDATLQRNAQVGFGADGRWSSFTRLELNWDEILVGGQMLKRFRPRLELDASPSRAFGNLQFIGYFVEEIDFDNAREGTGMNLSASGTWRPDDHTNLTFTGSTRWVDVDDPVLGAGRLFTASLGRARGTYMFNSRCFVRLIGQYLETTRDLSLYVPGIRPYYSPKDAGLSVSGLFAYKLNWQTVFYAGYGGDDAYSNATTEMEKNHQQAFLKVSYAWQH